MEARITLGSKDWEITVASEGRWEGRNANGEGGSLQSHCQRFLQQEEDFLTEPRRRKTERNNALWFIFYGLCLKLIFLILLFIWLKSRIIFLKSSLPLVVKISDWKLRRPLGFLLFVIYQSIYIVISNHTQPWPTTGPLCPEKPNKVERLYVLSWNQLMLTKKEIN